MSKINTFVAADNYFSQIPHWVLYADISPQAIRLYGVLQHYANKESGLWPSRETLAEEIRMKSPRTVDACIDELEKIGAVKVTKRFNNGGMQTSNYYTVITTCPDVQDSAQRLAEDCAPALQDSAPPPSNILRTKKNQLKTSNEQEPKDIQFDEFWATYPLKRDKGAAKKAFPKALNKISFEEIMAGVDRLVSDPNLEMKYCPYPATWLNGERWTDAPLPGRESRSEKFLKEFRQESAWLELE